MICPAGLLVDMERKGSLLWTFVAFSPKDLGALADGGWVYRGALRPHCGARLPSGFWGGKGADLGQREERRWPKTGFQFIHADPGPGLPLPLCRCSIVLRSVQMACIWMANVTDPKKKPFRATRKRKTREPRGDGTPCLPHSPRA